MKKLLSLLIFIIGQNENSFAQIKILDSIQVDQVISDFPVNFATIAKYPWQFVAYYNKDRYLTIASKKEEDRLWNYKVLPTKVGWDSHNSIVMALDRNDCLHVSGNMHADSMHYFKTRNQLDIDTFETIFPLVNTKDELSCTYPAFSKDANGMLIYTYRKGGSGNGNTINVSFDENTRKFRRLSNEYLFDGMNEMSAYSTAPKLGKDGYFHVAWVWRDTPSSETNHDLSYAKSKDLITWENMAGEKVQLPINPNNKKFIVDAVPAGGGIINGGFVLFFDKNNQPMFAFHKYDKAGISQMYIAKSDTKKWEIAKVSDWNHRWAFSGPGSMTSEIIIKNAEITNNQIIVKYWHLKRNNGEVKVDFETLRPISDVESKSFEESIYPEALNKPISGIEGMSTHWLNVSQSSDYFYALRWETLGVRRFYEKVEIPVAPLQMTMYKISKK